VRIPLVFRSALLTLATASVARAADQPRFAAPDVAAPIPSGATTGIGEVTLALLLVLATVFAIAWFARRLRAVAGGGNHGIEVLAQTSLGGKERAVIVRVGEARLLLGVAGGQVSLLHTLPPGEPAPRDAAPAASTDRPTFTGLLKKSLGR